jgi:hypothetical protein
VQADNWLKASVARLKLKKDVAKQASPRRTRVVREGFVDQYVLFTNLVIEQHSKV